MVINWSEKIAGEYLEKHNTNGGVFFNIEVGESGTSRANCRYILREVALDQDEKFDSIYLQNLSINLWNTNSSYKRFVSIISEWLGQIEDRELLLKGERTFYRVIISFGTKVVTSFARDLVAKYFQKYFPLNSVLCVVHQNSLHTHVHANLQARNGLGKKLDLDNSLYKSLDVLWGQIFAEHFGAHHLETHLQKKAETQEYKRALARGESREAPERYHYTRNDFHAQERRSVGYEKIRDYGDQREIAIESERIRERGIEIATREIERERPSERREQFNRSIIASERIVEREVGQESNNGQMQQRTDQLLARTIELDTRTVSTIRELREGVVPTVQRTDSRFERTDQQTRDSIAEIERTSDSGKQIERDIAATTNRIREEYSRIERTSDSSKQIKRDIATSTSRAREIDGTVREEYSRVERTSECCRQIERGIDGLTERTRELVITRQREYQLSQEIERERDYPSRSR